MRVVVLQGFHIYANFMTLSFCGQLYMYFRQKVVYCKTTIFYKHAQQYSVFKYTVVGVSCKHGTLVCLINI